MEIIYSLFFAALNFFLYRNDISNSSFTYKAICLLAFFICICLGGAFHSLAYTEGLMLHPRAFLVLLMLSYGAFIVTLTLKKATGEADPPAEDWLDRMPLFKKMLDSDYHVLLYSVMTLAQVLILFSDSSLIKHGK